MPITAGSPRRASSAPAGSSRRSDEDDDHERDDASRPTLRCDREQLEGEHRGAPTTPRPAASAGSARPPSCGSSPRSAGAIEGRAPRPARPRRGTPSASRRRARRTPRAPGRRATAAPTRRRSWRTPRAGGPREDQPDHDVQADGQRAAAEALEHPAGDQDLHRRRGAADDQAEREQHQRDGQRSDRPAPVAPGAGRDHADHAARERRGEGEGVEADAVELPGDRRHHGRDRGRLERRRRRPARTCRSWWRRTSGRAAAGAVVRGRRRSGSPADRRTSTRVEVNRVERRRT